MTSVPSLGRDRALVLQMRDRKGLDAPRIMLRSVTTPPNELRVDDTVSIDTSACWRSRSGAC